MCLGCKHQFNNNRGDLSPPLPGTQRGGVLSPLNSTTEPCKVCRPLGRIFAPRGCLLRATGRGGGCPTGLGGFPGGWHEFGEHPPPAPLPPPPQLVVVSGVGTVRVANPVWVCGGFPWHSHPKRQGEQFPVGFLGGYPRKPGTEARKIAPKSANRDGKSRVSPNRFPGRKRAVINYRGRGAAGRGAPLLRGQRGLEEAGTDLNRFTPTPSPGQSLGSA